MVHVVGCHEHDDPSVVAAALAIATARAGWRVVAIDLDTCNAQLGLLLRTPTRPGLSDVLAGESMDFALRPLSLDSTSVINVLASGSSRHEPSRLDHREVRRLIDRLAQRHDFVVVSMGPGKLDHASTLSSADQVVIALDPGLSGVEGVRSCVHDIRALGAEVVGVVVDRARAEHSFFDVGWGVGSETNAVSTSDPRAPLRRAPRTG
jgi:Mrp family chromosome partitioning ATPase